MREKQRQVHAYVLGGNRLGNKASRRVGRASVDRTARTRSVARPLASDKRVSEGVRQALDTLALRPCTLPVAYPGGGRGADKTAAHHDIF